jgi:hypothetical protein
VSLPPGYEPIGPGGSKGEKSRKWLSSLVWVVLIYLALAWWRGEPPTWRTVFNVLSIAAALLGLAGWRSTSERRNRRRLRRLFASGRVPELTEVTPLLEDIEEEDPMHDLTDRYARGMITPEEYFRGMAELLKVNRPFGGTRAAVLLLALGATGFAAGAHADKLIPTLEEVVDEASGARHCHEGCWLELTGAD